jgi:hypothetical protein
MKSHRILALWTGFIALLPALQANLLETLQHLEVESPEIVIHVDTSDDMMAAGDALTELYGAWLVTGPEIPPVPIDFKRLFEHLGISSIRSFTAASEKRAPSGYLNQSLLRFTSGPQGLFLIQGNANLPFSVASTAPADTDLAIEWSIHLGEALRILRSVIVDLMGPLGQGLLDAQLSEPVVPDGPTLKALFDRFNTRIHVIARIPETPAITPAGLGQLPVQNLVVRLAEVGDVLETIVPSLTKAGFVPLLNTRQPAWELSIQSETLDLYLRITRSASSKDLLLLLGKGTEEWINNRTSSLAESARYANFVEGLPEEGLGFWYNSERFASAQAQTVTSLEGLGPEFKPLSQTLASLLKALTGEQAGASFLENEALRTMAYQPASFKANVAIAGIALIPAIIAIEKGSDSDTGAP